MKQTTDNTRDEAVKYISLLKVNGVTITEIAKYLGVRYVTVYRWMNNLHSPKYAHLMMIKQLADYKGLRLLA